ncbi:MAG: hypothetical protein ACLTMH_15050 [Faecalimonas umbilicata]|uniref:hypothetical protein n=1 Tax=Faecalimonas umbilicata TaxID=1912855 RepID=UPI003993A0CB
MIPAHCMENTGENCGGRIKPVESGEIVLSRVDSNCRSMMVLREFYSEIITFGIGLFKNVASVNL